MSHPTGVMVVGAEGRMGLEVRAALEGEPTLSFAGALERAGHERVGEALVDGVVLQNDPKRALEGCGVAIDFSIPTATLANLRAAADAGVAYVTGTTGFDEAGKAEIARFAEQIPVLHAPNFSVSVNVLGHLAREAARLLGDDYDAELFELHHGQKRDAPSGTALFLAENVAAGQGKNLDDHVVLERAGETGRGDRDPDPARRRQPRRAHRLLHRRRRTRRAHPPSRHPRPLRARGRPSRRLDRRQGAGALPDRAGARAGLSR
jgi:4-hydroxy-tetrahydrodipicolinate reductase